LNSQTGLYTYEYALTNFNSSTKALQAFVIRKVPNPQSIDTPDGWIGVHGYVNDSTAMVWKVAKLGSAPPNWDGRQLFVGPYHVQPGQTVTGFRIKSYALPVQNVEFYAEEFDTLHRGGHVSAPVPKSIYQSGISGGSLWGPDYSLVGVPTPPKLGEGLAAAPNPTRDQVVISFTLSRAGSAKVGIFDVAGKTIRVLLNDKLSAGPHATTWDAKDAQGKRMPAGMYFYDLRLDGKFISKGQVVVLP